MATSRLVLGALLASVWLSNPTVAQEPAKPATPVAKPQAKQPAIYDEHADAKQQIAAAVKKAKQEDKRVLIQWGANWCHWCHLLHDLFRSDRAIATELRNEYEVVLVDMGKFDKNKDVAAGYGADIRGIPFLTVLDADGAVVVNQPTDPLEDGPKHSPEKVLAFLKEHQVPTKNAHEVLAAGVARAKAEGKLVFLHFGAPWCGWCHRLDDWMAREDVAPRLAKDFVCVKIDEDRMAEGKEVEHQLRDGKSGGIPWIVFLDGDGKPLVTSDGPHGNVGFPAKPEEIAHFVGMLNQVKQHLTAEDVAALEASLQPAAAGQSHDEPGVR